MIPDPTQFPGRPGAGYPVGAEWIVGKSVFSVNFVNAALLELETMPKSEQRTRLERLVDSIQRGTTILNDETITLEAYLRDPTIIPI